MKRYRKLTPEEVKKYKPLQERKWIRRLNKDYGYQASALKFKLKGGQAFADYDFDILEEVYQEYLEGEKNGKQEIKSK